MATVRLTRATSPKRRKLSARNEGWQVQTTWLSVERLTFRYESRTVLDDVSVDVAEGEALAILGPNGAGKTTLMGNVLGLLGPAHGKIRIAGASPQDAVKAGRVAAMLQENHLPAFARVGEILSLIRAVYPKSLAIPDVIQMAGIEGLLNSTAEKLSGGQRRRVQFAMAAVANADLLVLDEPTEGLDVEARIRLWEAVRTRFKGRTVVFTTHDLSEAERFSDRVLLLVGGKVRGLDTPDALKKNLARPRVRFRVAASHRKLMGDSLGLPLSDLGDGRVEVLTDDTDQVLFALAGHAGLVSQIETVNGSLTDVFEQLMKREEDR